MPSKASLKPIMPKATAIWLIDNTALTFDQIGEFCGMHPLEIQALADGETDRGLLGVSPIDNYQLTKEEIERCEQNSRSRLNLTEASEVKKIRKQKVTYTPIVQRESKPDGIAWILKNHPELSDAQIARMLHTTKNTIEQIRNKTHRYMATIEPKNPVTLGLCSANMLEKEIDKAKRHIEKVQEKRVKKSSAKKTEVKKDVNDDVNDSESVPEDSENNKDNDETNDKVDMPDTAAEDMKETKD